MYIFFINVHMYFLFWFGAFEFFLQLKGICLWLVSVDGMNSGLILHI